MKIFVKFKFKHPKWGTRISNTSVMYPPIEFWIFYPNLVTNYIKKLGSFGDKMQKIWYFDY